MVMLGVGKGQWLEGEAGWGEVAWALFKDEFPFFVEGMYSTVRMALVGKCY